MQLNELVDVLEYLEERLKSGKLKKLYAELISEIEQNKRSESKSGENRVAEQVELMKGYLQDIVPRDWGMSKWAIFTSIGGEKIFGKSSVDKIEKISKTPRTGYGALLKDLKKSEEEVSSLSKWISQLLVELKKIDDFDKPKTEGKEISQNDLVLKLIFKDRMKIKVMNQSVKFLSMWEKVFYYVSLLTKQKAKDVHIGIIEPENAGSDVFVVELIYNKITVAAVVKCMIQAYDLYAGTLEIKKKILEIKILNLENKQIEKALADEEKSMIGRIADTITAKQMKEYAWKEQEFQKISKAVTIALKYLLDYVERGGEVDFMGSVGSEEYTDLHENLFMARDRVTELRLDVALLKT